MSAPTIPAAPALIRSLMQAAIQPAGEAYSAELAQHGPATLAGRHACACGWLSNRPTDRGGAVSLGRHIAEADKAAEVTYNAAIARIAATLP